VQEYIVSIAREYLETVDQIRSGRFSTEEIYQLDSQRQLLHNEMCRITGYSRNIDMYRAARMIIRDGGYDE